MEFSPPAAGADATVATVAKEEAAAEMIDLIPAEARSCSSPISRVALAAGCPLNHSEQ